ncbi:MAG: RluA family pseudouridine synthase [Burkholderiales bacterium]
MEEIKLTVEAGADRLDKYIADNTAFSRSRIKQAILSGEALVNGKTAKPGDKLRAGDVVMLNMEEPKEAAAEPEEIPIDVVYEDSSIAVVNKPQGMVVHPAPGNFTGTMVGALLFRIKDLSGVGGEIRPGIVHRIDKDTSGLLVVAKNDEAHASLSGQIADRSMKRVYAAIVHGNIREDELTIDKPIGRNRRDRKKMAIDARGRNAVTHVKVLERFGEFTYIEAHLETGRTHQIRVHMASIGRPVAGDTVYGPKKPRLHDGGQLLHAKELRLRHPVSGEQMVFYAPLPDYFEKALKTLRTKTK